MSAGCNSIWRGHQEGSLKVWSVPACVPHQDVGILNTGLGQAASLTLEDLPPWRNAGERTQRTQRQCCIAVSLNTLEVVAMLVSSEPWSRYYYLEMVQ